MFILAASKNKNKLYRLTDTLGTGLPIILGIYIVQPNATSTGGRSDKVVGWSNVLICPPNIAGDTVGLFMMMSHN